MAAGFEILVKMMQSYNNFELERQVAEFAAESSYSGAMEAGTTATVPVAAFAMMLYAVWDSDEQAPGGPR